MVNEPGTIDCYVFIESKEQIEKILFKLYKIDNTEHICDQLKSIYQQIDGMHELKKIKRENIPGYALKNNRLKSKSYGTFPH